MKESDYYPLGAYEDPSAPFSEKEKEIEVCVSVKMHKVIKLIVDEDFDESDDFELTNLVLPYVDIPIDFELDDVETKLD